jgi:hypothetical protein
MARKVKDAASVERKPKPVAPSHLITDADRVALSQHHQLKVRAARRAADKIKATYDEAREEVNQAFALAKGDLGYSRKEFEEILSLGDMTARAFQNYEVARTGRLLEAGLKPPGTQMELSLGDTADDKAEAYQDGFRAGKRADEPEPPTHIATFLHTDWMAGWHEAQAENVALLGKAAEVIAARAKPVELQEDDGGADEEEDTEAFLAAKAKAVKLAWSNPTNEETSFETA